MSGRPQLRDEAHDRELDEQGYVVLRGVAAPYLRGMRRVHRSVVGAVPAGFDSTLYSGDGPLKARVHAELLAAMSPLLDDLLTGHRPLLTNFITKGRSPTGTMPPHQDWTFVDEPGSASLNVWVPLTAVDHRNGAMSVLPGAHRMAATMRGTDTPNAFAQIEGAAAQQMVELTMRAGDVLVHDHRLLHASPPNQRRRPRIVAGCAVIPAGAVPIHYRQVGPGLVERYELEDRFFVEHTFGADRLPASAHLVGLVSFEQPVFTEDDLPAALAR